MRALPAGSEPRVAVVTEVPDPEARGADDAPDILFPGEGVVVVINPHAVPGKEEAMAIETAEGGAIDLVFHGQGETVVVVGVAEFIYLEDGVGHGMGAVGE